VAINERDSSPTIAQTLEAEPPADAADEMEAGAATEPLADTAAPSSRGMVARPDRHAPFRLVLRRRARAAPTSPAARRPRWRRRALIALVVVVLLTSAGPLINSPVGAWGADVLRAALGPRLTAQIEAYYFNATDTLDRARVHLFGAPKAAPWAAPHGTPLPTTRGTAANPDAFARMHGPPPATALPQVQPMLSPALAGEGEWSAEGLPAPSYAIWPAPLAKTFLRPDPVRPYAVVMLVAIDLRQVRLHVVDGTSQPAPGGAGVVPAGDQAANLLLAAFNGGYKAADGHYGLMTDGRTYLPPQPDAATLALYNDGSVRMGAWGSAAIPTAGLIAYRQNGAPLIVGGAINPSAQTDGYAWGAPILANIYTWRSALAMTAWGVLIYAAGNAVSANTLAQALVRAGAVEAMQLDINPTWVRFDTYARSGAGGSLVAEKLRADMYGGPGQFLLPYQRDFFYVTRVEPKGWPKQVPASEVP
jgi:hypothetical protein